MSVKSSVKPEPVFKELIREFVQKGIAEPFHYAPCLLNNDPALHNWYGLRSFPGWRICLYCGAEEDNATESVGAEG